MPLQLTRDDQELVGKCLMACVYGSFFPDWEFHTLFGVTRDQVQTVAEAWPTGDSSNSLAEASVHNAINNLLGYPHGGDEELQRRFGVDRADLDRLASKLRGQ